MLLRFSVENFLSLRDRQELSLVASKLKDDESGLIGPVGPSDERLLPTALIYGANASGKSNLVAAIEFMRDAVLNSHRRGEPGGGVQRSPFALDPACLSAPTRFDIDFLLNGVRYHYGFEATDDAFTSEWLFSAPNNRRQKLFERNGQTFSFGRSLSGRNQIIADLTRPNSLFVAAAAQNGHDEMSKISDYFGSIQSDSNIFVPGDLVSRRFSGRNPDTRIVNFLRKIGTGIVDVRKRPIKNDDYDNEDTTKLSGSIERSFISNYLKQLQKHSWVSLNAVEFGHIGIGSDPIFFDMARESAGTRRLLLLLGSVFRALDSGGALIVDELNASLHTQACEWLLALFANPESNPKGAQLIATTHDTNLLASPYVRRDQIWLVEKDPVGASHLYPLTDIRTRKSDNIERGYLQGRFGAVPFAGRAPVLVSDSE